MGRHKWIVGLAVVLLASTLAVNTATARLDVNWETPKLPAGLTPVIDGDGSEWIDSAYTDGVWDWERIIAQPWFLADTFSLFPPPTQFEGAEGGTSEDFSFEFYSAWDDNGIYVLFDVTDNIWDIHSVGTGMSYANSDVASLYLDTKGGSGTRSDPGWLSYWWRAAPGQGSQDLVRRISQDPANPGSTAHFFGTDVPEALAETTVDPTEVVAGASGSNWKLETFVSWDGFTAQDPAFVAPFEGRELGWAFLVIDADGSGFNGQFFVHGGEGGGDPENASWTSLAPGGPVAVETASWGQVKQLLK